MSAFDLSEGGGYEAARFHQSSRSGVHFKSHQPIGDEQCRVDLTKRRIFMSPANLNQLQHHVYFIDILWGGIALHTAARKRALQN